ncbi:MAG: hypothetical protein JWQ38_2790 [Flavipsychrobacter sp.]|nr:hypothetical protein [Flavipsychrobacter sp.]
MKWSILKSKYQKMNNFPEELDTKIYIELYSDLKQNKFSEKDLKHHFEHHGKEEGRITNSIKSRHDFIPLIPKDASILEIGPFYTPVVKGEKVKYFDVLSNAELIERAKEHKYPVENVPFIHFVEPQGNLDIVNEQFDAVVSSHNMEHQPDLVDHLQKIEKILMPGGLYFCMIPDKRYCFDHFMPETTIADIISRNIARVKVHYLKSVIEHRALTTHNDPPRHWAGDHGPRYSRDISYLIKEAIKEYNEANGSYIDVHAHYFTPQRFSDIISELNDLQLTKLKIIRNYHTRRNQSEFFVIMQKAT